MAFDHRGRIVGNPATGHGGWVPMPRVTPRFQELANERQRVASFDDTKLVSGDPNVFNEGDYKNIAVYSASNKNENASNATALRKYAPMAWIPDRGEIIPMSKPTFTEAGAHRKVKRYVKKMKKAGDL
jgi:hypothetical protein